jgi:hypothetical protein
LAGIAGDGNAGAGSVLALVRIFTGARVPFQRDEPGGDHVDDLKDYFRFGTEDDDNPESEGQSA